MSCVFMPRCLVSITARKSLLLVFWNGNHVSSHMEYFSVNVCYTLFDFNGD
jgi:hypothetical protein